MTTHEAAILLNITPASVAIAILRGKLKATKRGRDYQLTRADVNAYKKTRRNINRKDCK